MEAGRVRFQADGLLVPEHGVVELTLLAQESAYVVVGQGEVRLPTQGLVVTGPGFGRLAQSGQHVAQIVVGENEARLQANRRLTVFQGRGQLRFLQEHLSQVAVGQRQVRVQFDGMAEVGHGLRGVAEQAASVAEVVVGQGEIRPQSYRRLELLGRVGRTILVQEHKAQLVVPDRIVRPELQGQAITIGGQVQLPDRTIRIAQGGVKAGLARKEGDGPPDQLDGLVRLAHVQMDQAQQRQSARVVGLRRQNIAVESSRLLQLATLMML